MLALTLRDKVVFYYWGANMSVRSVLYCIATLVCLTSCMAKTSEVHYFVTREPPTITSPDGIRNVFRLRITGFTALSNTRYIAGEYDRRAVELFLNEAGAQDYTAGDGQNLGSQRKIFDFFCDGDADKETCKKDYENSLGVAGIGAGLKTEKTTFVIILSSDATAISETIGSFATNADVLRSIVYLSNKDVFDEKAARDAAKPRQTANRKAVRNNLDALLEDYAKNESASDEAELQILQNLAVALEPTSTISFNSLAEAKSWFAQLQ